MIVAGPASERSAQPRERQIADDEGAELRRLIDGLGLRSGTDR